MMCLVGLGNQIVLSNKECPTEHTPGGGDLCKASLLMDDVISFESITHFQNRKVAVGQRLTVHTALQGLLLTTA